MMHDIPGARRALKEQDMGNTWIVDVTDFGDPRDPTVDIPDRARFLGEFFGAIVAAATAWPFPDTARTTALRCRRRPDRKPCPGLLDVVLVEEKEHIAWTCTECDDNGLIHGWRGTHWDLTSEDDDSRELDDTLDVILSHEEYAALLRIPWYDDDVRRTILSVQANREEVDLWGDGI